jgi:predicted Zn-dependent peptidase
MMAGMGADGSNAFTSFEQTVYTEDVPANVSISFLLYSQKDSENLF